MQIKRDIKTPLKQFKKIMAQKLKENEHKEHWLNDDIDLLFQLLRIEVIELEITIQQYKSDPRTSDQHRADVAREAADVANFAMFIADTVGGLK